MGGHYNSEARGLGGNNLSALKKLQFIIAINSEGNQQKRRNILRRYTKDIYVLWERIIQTKRGDIIAIESKLHSQCTLKKKQTLFINLSLLLLPSLLESYFESSDS